MHHFVFLYFETNSAKLTGRLVVHSQYISKNEPVHEKATKCACSTKPVYVIHLVRNVMFFNHRILNPVIYKKGIVHVQTRLHSSAIWSGHAQFPYIEVDFL